MDWLTGCFDLVSYEGHKATTPPPLSPLPLSVSVSPSLSLCMSVSLFLPTQAKTSCLAVADMFDNKPDSFVNYVLGV